MDREKKELFRIGIPSILIWLYFYIKFDEPHPLIYPTALMVVMIFILFTYKPNSKKLELNLDGFSTALFGSIIFGTIAIFISLFFD